MLGRACGHLSITHLLRSIEIYSWVSTRSLCEASRKAGKWYAASSVTLLPRMATIINVGMHVVDGPVLRILHFRYVGRSSGELNAAIGADTSIASSFFLLRFLFFSVFLLLWWTLRSHSGCLVLPNEVSQPFADVAEVRIANVLGATSGTSLRYPLGMLNDFE